MVAGAATWLAAPRDPPLWLVVALLCAGVAGVWAMTAWLTSRPDGWDDRARIILLSVCALLAAFALGLAAAQLRASIVATALYVETSGPVGVEGWVISNDASDNGPRLRLSVHAIKGLEAPPRYVRMAVPVAGVLTPGRGARCYGALGPPSGPMAPSAYDFARRAWFERLSATGYAFGRCRPITLAPPPARSTAFG